MKNSLKLSAAVVLMTLLSASNVYAQDVYASASGKSAFPGNGTAAENNSAKSSVAADPAIATKFLALFPAATDQFWANNDNTFWVSFLNNGRKATASFTVKGKMNYVITDCELKQLPASFRKTISKKYTSYSLHKAIEINAYDAVAYQAVLENESGYVTLKFTIDGVEEIQQVKKTR